MTIKELEEYLNRITKEAVKALNRNHHLNIGREDGYIQEYSSGWEFYVEVIYPKSETPQRLTITFEEGGLIRMPDSFKYGYKIETTVLSMPTDVENIIRFAYWVLQYGKTYKLL